MTEGEKQILRVAQDDHIGVLPGLPEGEKRHKIAGVRRQKTKSNDAGSPIRSGMTEGKNGNDRRGTWEGQKGDVGRTEEERREGQIRGVVGNFHVRGKKGGDGVTDYLGGVVCHGLFAIRYPTVMPSRPPRHHPASTSVG